MTYLATATDYARLELVGEKHRPRHDSDIENRGYPVYLYWGAQGLSRC